MGALSKAYHENRINPIAESKVSRGDDKTMHFLVEFIFSWLMDLIVV